MAEASATKPNHSSTCKISTGITSAKSLLSGMSHTATPDINETILPPPMEDLTKTQGKGESIEFEKGKVNNEEKHCS